MRRDRFPATILIHPIIKESTAMKKLITIAIAAVVALPVAANSAAGPTRTARKCHPSYKLKCLKPNAYDYDCIGGSGNGPLYIGLVKVVGPDVFRLDADHDGWGCE
jgi:hypothetical protein